MVCCYWGLVQGNYIYNHIGSAAVLVFVAVCAVWLECLHTYIGKTIESGPGPNVVHSEMNVELLDFFLGLVWNHGDNPVSCTLD